MKTIIVILLWFILFSISWPIAILLLLILPLIWLVLLPFRILGFTLEFIFRLIHSLFLFPFRVVKGL
ncbi:MAG: hypothetical protein OEY56_08525 [Cyclobacteriaceae bacterium]|nr:hypothetical protein [Cyclobacteriaceae bacterium]